MTTRETSGTRRARLPRVETKTFYYYRGIRLLADVMDVEETGVLDCFMAADSELRRTQVAPETDTSTSSKIARHEGVTPQTEDFSDADAEEKAAPLPAPSAVSAAGPGFQAQEKGLHQNRI